ncbi:MAG: HAMP domain-containing histidine kinase [Nitrospiraceae bacterium]|nr:HAMP domain-containing histidine kinase [Nitrospiraceae bacterium]
MVKLIMKPYEPSLRKKIFSGYYLILGIVILLGFVTLAELRHLEKKIHISEAITELFDTALEIRRYEKNWFLYHQQNDLDENTANTEKALTLLDSNIKSFNAIAGSNRMSALADDLKKYSSLMRDYSEKRLSPESRIKHDQENRIRTLGKKIVDTAQELSKSDRQKLEEFLNSVRTVLFVSVFIIIIAGLIFGQAISTRVVKPLSDIELSLNRIAEGEFKRLASASKDREMVSLINAVNKMASELELRQKHLVRSEKLAALGTMLSGVAHELNNPLSNISTSCQILQEEISDTDIKYKKELLEQIEEQTERAKKTVRMLLDFSRDKPFVMQKLQLSKVINETLQLAKTEMPAERSVKSDIPDNLYIDADRQRMQQAFLNLLKNAFDAGGDVHIKAWDEGQHVQLSFSDSGHGIPQEIIKKIFDPFFTTKDVGKGSGLGLFIVYEIIEEHGGTINAESQPGKGTTFTILLNRHQDEYQENKHE